MKNNHGKLGESLVPHILMFEYEGMHFLALLAALAAKFALWFRLVSWRLN